ncbi:MAG: DUF3592 domain-containing protein [Armatimonadota bacterium]
MRRVPRQKNQVSIGGIIILFLFGLIPIIIGYFFLKEGVHDIVRSVSSKDWPHVNGIMTLSGGYHSRRGPQMWYEYSIDGEQFTGSRISYGMTRTRPDFFSKEFKIINRYPVGKRVTVYYMPHEPGESVLEPGFRMQVLFVPVCSCLFIIAGSLAGIYLPYYLIKSRYPGKVKNFYDK